MHKISFFEFEELFNILKQNNISSGDPIPEMNSRSEEKIKSALQYPFQSAFGEEIYKTIESKAAAILYLFAKGHFLSNGNKRMAIIVFEYFLQKNEYQYDLSNEQIEQLIYDVTTSSATDKENQIKHIAGKLKQTPQ